MGEGKINPDLFNIGATGYVGLLKLALHDAQAAVFINPLPPGVFTDPTAETLVGFDSL